MSLTQTNTISPVQIVDDTKLSPSSSPVSYVQKLQNETELNQQASVPQIEINRHPTQDQTVYSGTACSQHSLHTPQAPPFQKLTKEERSDSRFVSHLISADQHATNEYFAIDSSKKALAVQNYFRDKQFIVNTTQSIHRSISDYEISLKQICLNAQPKIRFFVIVFGDQARDYFFDNCRDDMTFTQLACVIASKYDSDARRLVVQSELEMLTLENFMAERNIFDNATRLFSIAEHINVLKPQCHPSFCSDSNKIHYPFGVQF